VLGLVAGAFALAVFLLSGGGSSDQSESPPAAQTAEAAQSVAEPTGPPTPCFASYKSLQLALPVPPDDVTLVAFHQAAGSKALHVDSLVADTDMEALAARTQDGDFPSAAQLAQEHGTADDARAIWQGEVLRLWRSGRSGPPDTAIDVGAAPGSEVRAPVTGSVIAVRAYDLYGSLQDYEIHIQPDGWPEVDVVLIHVTDVLVSEGDHVVGGLTPIASVRHLSDDVALQLSGYTADGGDHVHLQLNELPDPAMLEYIGDS
jgi:murein DD-endopeptidase MepM/ murein hydrolase activator NlpD